MRNRGISQSQSRAVHSTGLSALGSAVRNASRTPRRVSARPVSSLSFYRLPFNTLFTTYSMSFAALRASARRATASTARVSPRVAVRNAAVRRYATEGAPPPPPKSSSNAALFGALGAAVFAGGAFYVFSSSDSAAEASSKSSINTANYVPTKEDYQKVSVAATFFVPCPVSILHVASCSGVVQERQC